MQPAPAAQAAPVRAGVGAVRLQPADEMSPSARRCLTGGVLAAHLLGGWALLQVDSVRQAVIEAAPMMVSLIAPTDVPKPVPPPPPPPQQIQKPHPAPAPLIAAAPTPAPAAPSFVVPEPAPAPPAPVATAPAPPAPPAPPVVAAPPAPKVIPANAVRYLAEPRMTVPVLSRRLGEQGIVYLRIVVDTRGVLKDASVKKSSGFARLDQQALQDIRSARFAPQTENGQPIEWETTAPLSYELDQ
ncbi:MAG: energy transducer TonB [Burkholderiaceae bacterium]|nr:energy transducer TonB [Burkholderiaceae bacterium]